METPHGVNSLSQHYQRQTGRLSWEVVETVVLWGISLLPHGQQWGMAFEVRHASPQGVEIGYCCKFRTAK